MRTEQSFALKKLVSIKSSSKHHLSCQLISYHLFDVQWQIIHSCPFEALKFSLLSNKKVHYGPITLLEIVLEFVIKNQHLRSLSLQRVRHNSPPSTHVFVKK